MRILACDDEDHVGETLRAALSDHEVEFTTLATSCLESWTQLRPDVVILDRVMPGTGGMEVARRLRGEGFGGPIYLFSAFTGADIAEDARSLGVIPVPKTDVVSLVNQIEKDATKPSAEPGGVTREAAGKLASVLATAPE